MSKLTIRLKGGAGSGHHGHRGRPGEQGGSLPAGSQASASSKVNLMWNELDSIRDLEDELMNDMKNRKFKSKADLSSAVKKRISESGIQLGNSSIKDVVSNVSNTEWFQKRLETSVRELSPAEAIGRSWGNEGFYELDSGIKIWKLTGHERTNSYIGAARVLSNTYTEDVTKKGDILHNIPGGMFIQRKGTNTAEAVKFFRPPVSVFDNFNYYDHFPKDLKKVEGVDTGKINYYNP
jgi:hypothetical protein